jgi:hypothetical protein
MIFTLIFFFLDYSNQRYHNAASLGVIEIFLSSICFFISFFIILINESYSFMYVISAILSFLLTFSLFIFKSLHRFDNRNAIGYIFCSTSIVLNLFYNSFLLIQELVPIEITCMMVLRNWTQFVPVKWWAASLRCTGLYLLISTFISF